MDPPPQPDGELVLHVLTTRLLAMPASAFVGREAVGIPRRVLRPLPRELRAALRDVAACSAQAAAVARLARVSRTGNLLSKASSSLNVHARAVSRAKQVALCDIVNEVDDAEILDRRNVLAALLTLCTLQPAENPAALWQQLAASVRETMAAEPDAVGTWTIYVEQMSATPACSLVVGGEDEIWRARRFVELVNEAQAALIAS